MISRNSTGTVMQDAAGNKFRIIRVSKNNTRVFSFKTGEEGFLPTQTTTLKPAFTVDPPIPSRTTEVPLPSREETFKEGMVVTMPRPQNLAHLITPETLLVVTAVNNKTIRLVNLGGRSDGRYFRASPGMLKKVEKFNG